MTGETAVQESAPHTPHIMACRVRTLSVALALVALTAPVSYGQGGGAGRAGARAAQAAQVPAPAVPVPTITASPSPASVNDQVTLQVSVTPLPAGTLVYQFLVNDRLLDCAPNSSACVWRPGAPGDYRVKGRVLRPAPGRRGGAVSIDGPEIVVTVASPVATVVANPSPAVSGQPVSLQVTLVPAIQGPFRFEFNADGAPIAECAASEAVCLWTPMSAGTYVLTARAFPVGQDLVFGGPETALLVSQAAPLPALSLTRLSQTIVVGQEARFSVTLGNAPPADVAIDMGDGQTVTRAPGEFGYTFTQPGPVKVVASYPADARVLPSQLTFTVEPAAPPPVAQELTLRIEPNPANVGEPVTFIVSTRDGSPIRPYTLDIGDGLGPRTMTTDRFVAPYSRAGRYTVEIRQVVGQNSSGFSSDVRVTRRIPWWIWFGSGVLILGVGGTILRKRRRPAPLESSGSPEPPPSPTPTFHPKLAEQVKFTQPTSGSIRLEVRFSPNMSSLRYAPRVRITREQS